MRFPQLRQAQTAPPNGIAHSDVHSRPLKPPLEIAADRNRDDPNAEQRFQEIGEAYQILSDSDLRGAYDRYGKKSDQSTPEAGFMDPGQLFAQLFGGERFYHWIGEIRCDMSAILRAMQGQD